MTRWTTWPGRVPRPRVEGERELRGDALHDLRITADNAEALRLNKLAARHVSCEAQDDLWKSGEG